MQNTENFNLKVYEGEDLFNPLTVENVNIQSIDTQMKKNENHAVGDATELVSGTVHAITRLTPDAPMLRFTATSRFTAGDTFTVDGVQVSALTVSGEQLPDGAYIIGSEVLAYLKGTLLTVFTSQGTLATAKNALKLGGNDPEYYATASAVQTAQETATAAGNLANEVNNSLTSMKYKSLEVGIHANIQDYSSGKPKVSENESFVVIECHPIAVTGSNLLSENLYPMFHVNKNLFNLSQNERKYITNFIGTNVVEHNLLQSSVYAYFLDGITYFCSSASPRWCNFNVTIKK